MIALFLAVAVSLAGPADDLLAEVDRVANQGDSAHLTVEITAGPEDERVARTLEIWQHGDDQRLIRYTEPARLRGISLLVPDGETLYLYLPSYGKVRRVVGRSRGNAFQGTDFAMEDLARIRWSDDYVPALSGPDHLTLTPRDRSSASARVELYLGPDRLPRRVEHYDADGVLIRRIAFGDVRTVGPRPLAHQVVVEDLTRSRSTEARVTAAEVDTELDESLFTVRSLTR